MEAVMREFTKNVKCLECGYEIKEMRYDMYISICPHCTGSLLRIIKNYTPWEEFYFGLELSYNV